MPAGVLPSLRERLARPSVEASDGALCGECGYELEGLLDPESSGLCPECGGAFNPYAPHRPWTRAQWVWFLVGGCGPTVLLLGLAWVITLVGDEGLRTAMGIAGPFWAFMLAYATLVWPALWTGLRRDERSKRERRRMLISAYAGALLPIAGLVGLSLL